MAFHTGAKRHPTQPKYAVPYRFNRVFLQQGEAGAYVCIVKLEGTDPLTVGRVLNT